jgi:two-component system NtrC family sensor kinase
VTSSRPSTNADVYQVSELLATSGDEAATTMEGATETSFENSYRILVVDDNPSIHADFQRILGSANLADSELDELAASLFGIESSLPGIRLLLDSVYQGEEAFAAVEKANEQERPYALVFMDIRMQPGWNGVETAARLFDIDEFVQIVLCSAYADYEWRQWVEPLIASDRVLLLKKPFDPLEVRQLANAMCHKWTLALRDRRRMQELERAVSEKTRALEAANAQLRREIAERTRAECELRRAQRLEGLGRLAAGLCHEINNPLTFIVGSIEAMDDTFQEVNRMLPRDMSEELDELLRTVAVGADRITQIVRNVKLLSRQNDADVELVDVHASMDTAAEMMQRSLGSHIEVRIEFDRGTPMRVMGRRLELEQVLVNLLENASHALAGVAEGNAVIRVHVQALSERVQITVADSGPGIPEDVLDKIFDPFFTTKPVNQGTGLGLSICHSLVSGMNGTIEVKSQLGRGTTFTITMPAVSAELLMRASALTTETAVEREFYSEVRGCVLVIDDEPLILKILQRVLRGHDVTTVSNVNDALSLCMHQTFDLILSDIMMPGISGRDFYHMLASARPGDEEKIVFITGGTLIEEVLVFLDSVSNLCLEKPIDVHALRTLIAERVDTRLPHS